MSENEFGTLGLLLLLLLATAHLLGYIMERLHQPRVIGEILAGLAVASVLGWAAPDLGARLTVITGEQQSVLGFVYFLGLMFLMFLSGTATRHLFVREDRGPIVWLVVLGTGIPFTVVLLAHPVLPIEILIGEARHETALMLVIGIAVAVTSIPVISRIFHDLGIIDTPFARLVLGVAVVEDMALWAVLAVATALASAAGASEQDIALHIFVTIAYFVVALSLAPPLLRRLGSARWNIVGHASPVGYAIAVLFAYTALAAALGVSLVFAAFLAGLGIGAADGERSRKAIDSISEFSFAFFIPMYFALVGCRLDLANGVSLSLVAATFLLACTVKLFAVGLGAKLARFKNLEALNLAVATNARGGPGIVVAGVAFDAAIISAPFYTALVLLAVFTSQAAGAWLSFVLRRGWPLLGARTSGRSFLPNLPRSQPFEGQQTSNHAAPKQTVSRDRKKVV